jgi:hypothetical protein
MGAAGRPAGKGFSIGWGNGRKIPKWRERTQPSVAKEGARKGCPSEAGRFNDKLLSMPERSEG